MEVMKVRGESGYLLLAWIIHCSHYQHWLVSAVDPQVVSPGTSMMQRKT
jgi:hypothetical protein